MTRPTRFRMPAHRAGITLLAFFAARFTCHSREEWAERIRAESCA